MLCPLLLKLFIKVKLLIMPRLQMLLLFKRKFDYLICQFWGTAGSLSQLNRAVWRRYISDYWDKQLPDLLEYGFPLDFDRECPLSSSEDNHFSAYQFSRDIDMYLNKEVAYNAMLCPFTNKPIDMHVSPLMT